MLTLYSKTTCAFSRRVVAVLDRLGLEYENKNITENSAFADELEALGGMRQTPYLIDTERDVSLYESDAIVAHLQTYYGAPTPSAIRPRIHVGGSTCVSCEG